jgi:hypothetical protein
MCATPACSQQRCLNGSCVSKREGQRCAVLCCAVLCCAVLCCAVLCCAVLCCAVLLPSSCTVLLQGGQCSAGRPRWHLLSGVVMLCGDMVICHLLLSVQPANWWAGCHMNGSGGCCRHIRTFVLHCCARGNHQWLPVAVAQPVGDSGWNQCGEQSRPCSELCPVLQKRHSICHVHGQSWT